MHSDDKKFQCPCCAKILSSKQNLKEHMFTHSGEKPYHCQEIGCGMRFRQGSQLSAHRRIHKDIGGKSSKSFFHDVKVIVIQLSEILIKNPYILDNEAKYELFVNDNFSVDLPVISNPQENIILPSLFS